MVKKCFCDKCGIEVNSSSDSFDDLFNEGVSLFEDEPLIIQPHLCSNCNKGYVKIIKRTNKEIEDYLQED